MENVLTNYRVFGVPDLGRRDNIFYMINMTGLTAAWPGVIISLTYQIIVIRTPVSFLKIMVISPAVLCSALISRSLIFRVGEGEAEEVILVQVHDDQFVRRRQVHRHLGEFFVKVARVPAAPLQGGVWRDRGRVEENAHMIDGEGAKREHHSETPWP